ncbi:MAG TPA: hypothetical protein VJ866_05895 [Pyrinomonadaceae bacterium]|nr:hypothetical protein [Pyrinomonadaceae bacterium]
MTMTAQALDHTPAAFRRILARHQEFAGSEKTVSLLDDTADGILAVDFALTFAGFSYQARQLSLSIVGLLGGGGGRLEIFDKRLAEHLNCSDRTIRRWRAAHIRESKAKKFALLRLEEGDYTGQKRYEKTAYSLNPHLGLYLAAVVREARASDLYRSDRRAAVERAAEEHYHDIPNAPPRARRRKPRQAPSVKVEQAFVNAVRNVEKGRQALQDLEPDSRAALLESRQGEELRQTLLKLWTDIGDILTSLPQSTEVEDLDRGLGQSVLTPVAEPSPEDVAAWGEVERRVVGSPQVITCEVNLRPPLSVEELEAEAVRAEGCGEV